MLKIGTVIDGKYKILDVIGRGGMSVVYLAINEKANRPWAIKEILKKDFRAEKKEIHMMKRLHHPRLPGIADVIEEEESLLIVMDYIEGRSLGTLLEEQGAQPEKLVLDWAKQICEVLIYLHSRTPAIIYRDMKPANVMLKPDGNVVLIDFGAAREHKPRDLGDTVALGTRGYAAPEQYESGGQSDARTDIYSLGVMMFQLVTGESPHQLQPVRNLNPHLSSGLEEIITRCTQLKKEDRYQSCAELLYALEHYWEYDSAYRKKHEVFQQQISEIKDKGLLQKIAKALKLATELYNLIRLNGYDELIEKLDFHKFKRLLSEVENRIAKINQSEALKSGQDITMLLNEALEDSVFIFRKTGESQLDLAANSFKDALRKTREAMERSPDKKDPIWVSLKEEIERLLRDKNWEEADAEDIESGTKILDDIYARISELNRKALLLAAKYEGDLKYVRLHHELIRMGLSQNEQKVYDILMQIKHNTDETLLLNENILVGNDAYFESYIQQQVIQIFKSNAIKLNPEVARLVKSAIVREYINEREGIAA